MPASRAGGGSVRRSHRAIAGEVSVKDRKLLKRPRVIFSTSLTQKDSLFDQASEASRRRRRRRRPND